jgi:hypothetical protein
MNSKNPWSAGEDAALVALRSSGLGWTGIAKRLNVQRSAKICRNRWVYTLDPLSYHLSTVALGALKKTQLSNSYTSSSAPRTTLFPRIWWRSALPAFLGWTLVEDFSALKKSAETGGFMR